jgi:hypothetical protein
MKKYLIFFIALFIHSNLIYAQNNAIFFGGSGDGNVYEAFAQNSNLILYEGGSGDGWSTDNYEQLSTGEIFVGGSGDGWNTDSYAQSSTDAVYFGGNGDGFNLSSYSQSSTTILYNGGVGDGWANTYSVIGPLPVTLLSFDVTKKEHSALLNWETSSEINSSFYSIEKSNDAVNFNFLARIESNNNPNGSKYELLDENPTYGYNYYRIKMVDIDGQFKYTPTRHVIFDGYDANPEIHIYPNPSNGALFVAIPMLRNLEPMVVNITNSFGQVVKQQKTDTNQKVLEYDLNGFAKGIYYIQVKSKSFQQIEKIVLQ